MASDADELYKNIENIKSTVRQSFARVYASLKARELKTLRQLDALRKQCQDDKDLVRNCVQNIHICYDNESMLLDNVSNYGVIDFENLNFDSSTFLLEDYVSPNDDHMYSYKTIDDLTKDDDNNELEAIEEAAMKEITKTDNCVCYVDLKTEDISKKFRDTEFNKCENHLNKTCDVRLHNKDYDMTCSENVTEDEKSDSSDPEMKKINPTDDWLNSIKSQTEIEPTVADAMEHNTIWGHGSGPTKSSPKKLLVDHLFLDNLFLADD